VFVEKEDQDKSGKNRLGMVSWRRKKEQWKEINEEDFGKMKIDKEV
jgi:hypothetical protein